MYSVVFFDALRVKVRDEGTVKNKAIYPVLGVRRDGTRNVLGLWIEQTEGVKFWLRVVNDLKLRGVASPDRHFANDYVVIRKPAKQVSNPQPAIRTEVQARRFLRPI